jgi:hypothetical protein
MKYKILRGSFEELIEYSVKLKQVSDDNFLEKKIFGYGTLMQI